MVKLKLQCSIFFLLVIVTIVGAMDSACYDPPTLDYSALLDCCQGSAITYSEEVMTLSNNLPNKRARKKSPKELILMNSCKIHSYLNYSGLIDDDGAVQKERLIDFLEHSIQNDGAHITSLLRSLTDKCLRSAQSSEEDEELCETHYSALINCIQKEIYTNCPVTYWNSSDLCSTCRSFVIYCGVGTLKKSLQSDESEYSSSSTELESAESESESTEAEPTETEPIESGSESIESESTESEPTESESHSSSDSHSDYEYENETELTEVTLILETTPIIHIGDE